MNRRDFSRAALATALVPSLPRVAGAGAAARATVNPITYAWAAHYASLNGGVTAQALARRFALPPQTAAAIFSRLCDAGVVSMPNAMGLARIEQAYARPRVTPKPKAVARAAKAAARAILDDEDAQDAAVFTKA